MMRCEVLGRAYRGDQCMVKALRQPVLRQRRTRDPAPAHRGQGGPGRTVTRGGLRYRPAELERFCALARYSRARGRRCRARQVSGTGT